MVASDERIAKLEERVFVQQSTKLLELSAEVKSLTNRLNYLIVILAGNFGVAAVKLLPALSHLLQ